MNLVLTILRRELTALPRRKRFYLARCALVAVGAAVVLAGMAAAAASRSTTVGLMLFIPLSVCVLLMLSMTAASTASAQVTRERRERTLGLLFLSDISPWDFVGGKLFTSLFSTFMAVLSALPLFILAVSLGGVSVIQVLTAAAVLLSTVLLAACMGLATAAAARTENMANSLLGLAYVATFILAPVALMLWAAWLDLPFPEACLTAMSPFVAMGSLAAGQGSRLPFVNCAISAALALPALWIARAVVPRTVFSREAPGLAQRLTAALKSGRQIGRWMASDPVRGNPVCWKDLHFWHGGRRGVWTKWLLATALVLAIMVFISVKLREGGEKDVLVPLATCALVYSAGVFALGSVSNCGLAFHRERAAHAMELLATTGLTDREIAVGKIAAAMGAVWPWLASGLVSLAALALHEGHDKDFRQVVGVAGIEYASMWFGYSCLALWISLRFRRNVAFAVCVGSLLLWNTAGRLAVGATLETHHASFWWMVVMDVLAHVAVGALCLSRVLSSFRRQVLLDAEDAG